MIISFKSVKTICNSALTTRIVLFFVQDLKSKNIEMHYRSRTIEHANEMIGIS